jgi:hypothetical protein
VRFSIVSGGAVCVAAVLLCIPLLPRFWRYRPEAGPATAPPPAAGL